MSASAARLLDTLTAALAGQIDERGLLDPFGGGRPTAPDHYGNTAAALALAAGPAPDWPRTRQALNAWVATDRARLGHLPFNRLLLTLLGTVLKDRDASPHDIASARSAVGRCRLQTTYPSNNWTLLAQTCRVLEAPAEKRPAESATLCRMFDRWTTPAGGFIDFPARPRRHVATPLAYHHKALFLAALAHHFHSDPSLARHVQRLLDWLVHCWDPAGFAGGLGRSNHALFGDACLLSAMILLGLQRGAPEAIDALVTRLEAQRRPDGLLWLTPSGSSSGGASWDSYMRLSVYNAWAAATIGVALHLRRETPCLAEFQWRAADTGCFHDPDAGILFWRSPSGTNALISTHGQPPQSFSRNEADFRYAGGVPMHLTRDGLPLIPPPVRVKRGELQRCAALAGWTPLFRFGDEIHALTDFEHVSVAAIEDGVHVELEGAPRRVFRATAKTLFGKILSAVDWRLLDGHFGRHATLKRAAFPAVRAKLSLRLTETPELRIFVTLRIEAAATGKAYYLNPRGHSWIAFGSDEKHRGQCGLPASLPEAVGGAEQPVALPVGLATWSFDVHFDAPGQRNSIVTQSSDTAPGHYGAHSCSP